MRRAFNPGYIIYESGLPQPSSGGYITWDTDQQYILDGHIYIFLEDGDPDAEEYGEGWYWYIITEDDDPVYNWYGSNPPAGADPWP